MLRTDQNDLTFKVESVEAALVLTKELDFSAIHAFAFCLDELRRAPKEQKKQELTDWFHKEWGIEPGKKNCCRRLWGWGASFAAALSPHCALPCKPCVQ